MTPKEKLLLIPGASPVRRLDLRARAVRAGFSALGVMSFTAAPFLASTLSVVSYPEGVDDKAFRAALDGGMKETRI
jgi:aspartate aminotransferase-like enzyme